MFMSTNRTFSAHGSSFRDPAGFIFEQDGIIYRQINQAAKDEYDHLMLKDGLYHALIKAKLLIPHEEIDIASIDAKNDDLRYKIIKPEAVPFISYPYEWSFPQLKDAALLTLKIQEIAIEHGMILKDASAYNVQFIGKRAVFIDTLSFAKYEPGKPWDGYRQFCEHFIAPLAAARYTSYDSLSLLKANLEGIPLSLTASILPKRARLNAGILSHIILHSASQKRYERSGAADSKAREDARQVKTRRMSKMALLGLMSSLKNTVNSLQPPKSQTEWGDYYDFTNYSEDGFKQKHAVVGKMLKLITPRPSTVWDFGANNGEFSQIAAKQGITTIAWDIDPIAVGRNYLHQEHVKHMLPLIQDCVNPSPSIGWLGKERDSLFQRGPADAVLALAIIHHLAIGRNLPLSSIAEFFSMTGKHIIVEFVPKGDSKVDVLLASRTDIFPDYTIESFESAMEQHFLLIEKQPIEHTKRTLYLYGPRS